MIMPPASEMPQLAAKLRNALLTPGEDQKALDYIKNMFHKLAPVAKQAGIDISKVDIDKLDKQTVFNILSQDNITKYSGNTVELMKTIAPFLGTK